MKKASELRLIRKYQNRRLYDVATSTYVVLKDIKDIIVQGDTIQVFDVSRKQDVTRSVLLQVILEEEVNGVPMFSDEFLLNIIRFYGQSFQTAMNPLLEQGIKTFQNMHHNFYEQYKKHNGSKNPPIMLQVWKNFLAVQTPTWEESLKQYVEKNSDGFLLMQQNLQQQTQQMFDYIKFPFSTINKKKK